MFDDREGVRVERDQGRARKAALNSGERWTLAQAARLDASSEEILVAVRRGWLPEQIEGVTSKYALEDDPPPLEGVPDWVDAKIDRAVKGKSGPTALAVAFHKAKAA